MKSKQRLCGAAIVFATAALCGTPASATLVISNAATMNVTCSAGVCTPTSHFAVLNKSDLAGMLASSDITVRTGSRAQDIDVKAGFSWTSANRLTLDAYHSITFKNPVEVTGSGALTLTTNDGGTDGTLSFTPPGRVHFWDLGSSLIVNGATYTLVGNIATLATAIAGDPTGHYALANNYDATADGPYAHPPIPTAFSGAFEGLGNAISKLAIQDTIAGENVGFFASLNPSGSIENISMTSVFVAGGGKKTVGGLVAISSGRLFGDFVAGLVQAGAYANAGGLAGSSSGPISYSHSAGTVKFTSTNGLRDAGGLVAINSSSIDHSYSTADVSGGDDLGGIAARSYGGAITHSYATGSVTGDGYVGGLVGLTNISDVTIEDSYATGAVSGAGAGGLVGGSTPTGDRISGSHATGAVSGSIWTGGLVGESSATISNSYATGTVSGNNNASYAGGLVGSQASNSISGSFATGTVSGNSNTTTGGLVGSLSGSAINNSYATGAVHTGQNVGGLVGRNYKSAIDQAYEIGAVSDGTYVGGFTGYNEVGLGKDQNCYWDTTTSGASSGTGHGTLDGITGVTSAQLQSGLPAGFDPSIWAQDPSVNGGFPYLIANPPP